MRRNERATPKFFDRVVTENEIRPRLRFLLSDEAKAEGKQMSRNFRGYTLSRSAADTRCQFESLVRGIQDGSFPNIAAADELMDGALTASLQKIADGFRQPETMLWYQSWAVHLEKGRPDLMQDAAVRMMTRDERWLPRIVDDETDQLPRTFADPVHAGGSGNSKGRAHWVPKHDVALFRHYRDFLEFLADTADGDDTVRVVQNPAVTERYSLFLALKPGRDGGAALIVAQKGISPAERAGTTFRLDPTTTAISLAAALSNEHMRKLARAILSPGSVDPVDIAMFGEGLKSVTRHPYADDSAVTTLETPATKPPCLERELWRLIPRDQRKAYVKEMARCLKLGVHPNDTVTDLLAAA